MLALPIDPELEKRLEALGAHSDSTKATLARDRLIEALDEDLQDLRLAKERLAQPARRWTQEELEQGVDLEC